MWSATSNSSKAHAPIPQPAHPTFDLAKVLGFALEEDAADRGDVTSIATVPEDKMGTAVFLAKSDGVLAGLAVADKVFELVDPKIKVSWTARDGDAVTKGQEFGRVTGPARSILTAERVALNYMQRMSGVATQTRQFVKLVEGTGATILETRKTAPGLRVLDKWAVLIGGGSNHRMGLYDMMMIKDNHITAAGSIRAAVERAEAYRTAQGWHGMQIEVETRTLAEVDEILEVLKEAGPKTHVTRVMLDNMTKADPSAPGGVDVSLLKEAVAKIAGAVETEASGNVNLTSARAIAETGVTYISIGSLTHSVTAMDISLKIRLE